MAPDVVAGEAAGGDGDEPEEGGGVRPVSRDVLASIPSFPSVLVLRLGDGDGGRCSSLEVDFSLLGGGGGALVGRV